MILFKEMKMLSALENANSILLCTHINPDGDAIGSTLAMGMALKAKGKQVTMACADPVPGRMLFLPGAESIVKADALAGKAFDAAMAIDVAELHRMGNCRDAFLSSPVTMQIDHHPTNPGYACLNEVDGAAPAAGCIVYRALKAMNAEITKEIAACLYCGISTDSGNFCFPSMSSEAFSIMAELMDCGLEIGELARKIHRMREIPHVKLLGKALATLHFFADGKCAGMRLTRQDYLDAEALQEHSSKIVNYGIDLPGVEMVYLADGAEEGFTQCSLRALPGRDVSKIARKFGGGGHVLAAGCRTDMKMDDFCRAVEEEMLKQIEEKQ